ncbi:MAG: transketolase [Alphaproteobacteria bacterium]|nr:transketolase [Alphaproteobacteria bacterium]
MADAVPLRRSRRAPQADTLRALRELERKVLWLSSWTIHHANHLRASRDGLKVGGHQASSASVVTLLTALFFHAMRSEDRIAVKPHASPVFHAIQYLLGNQSRENLVNFRALGGAQSYPSRTKDVDDVDFSTGSVGLGVAATLFGSLVQDYVRLHGFSDRPAGRMVAIMGDAELDEGNIYEALLEGWKHDVRNLWWIVDYNRQSLDSVVSDHLFQKIKDFFQAVGWKVVMLKYGKRLEAAFARPGGEALRRWIDECSNDLYSALTYKGGKAWREHLSADLGGTRFGRQLLDEHDDDQLHVLMTNLAGHDMEAVLEAFDAVDSDVPHCFIAYTVKGFGLPFAGHKDNHAGLMNLEQMAKLKSAMGVADGAEWDRFAGLSLPVETLEAFLKETPFAQRAPKRVVDAIPVPAEFPVPEGARQSTQEAFGRILNELGKGDSALASRIVTTSPDVTVSTNLGGWVNQRAIFNRADRADVFRDEKVISAQRWAMHREGQHMELFDARLLPIGTVYDPFIARGLDALNYACYQDARFMLVATPSGITLAPEGGAHQSIIQPLIGMGQPGLTSYEPAYADELAAIMAWSFRHMQAEKGGSVYLRLSTRPLEQIKRQPDAGWREAVVAGGYWAIPPAPGTEIAIAYCGAVAPEVLAAHAQIAEDVPGAGLLAVTSPDRLHADWLEAQRTGRSDSHAERLLGTLAPAAGIITILDGHPATLSWLGSVDRHRVRSLGVEKFGQSGDIPDLYRTYGIDTDAIVDAAAGLLLA